MGQYFRPIFVNNKGNPIATTNKCYDFREGAKLMEHSYFNNFVGTAIDYIRHNPKSRLVWCGDYADDTCKMYNKQEKKWVKTNLYKKVKDNSKIKIHQNVNETYEGWYIVNHTKHIYIKYAKSEKNGISPLPILTSFGNGRGNGDYWGTQMDFVGSWKGNMLSVVENENEVPQGYKFVEYEFDEE